MKIFKERETKENKQGRKKDRNKEGLEGRKEQTWNTVNKHAK